MYPQHAFSCPFPHRLLGEVEQISGYHRAHGISIGKRLFYRAQ